MSETDYCLVDCVVTRVTEKAALLELNDGREVWVPRSCIEDGEDTAVFDKDVAVAEWFVDKEGL